MKNVNIIDCTFRDGGYYTSWDFDLSLVNRYLSAVRTAGIELIELGYRFRNQSRFVGAFGYCTEEFLRLLDVPEDIRLAVMINAKEYRDTGAKELESLFPESSESKVSMVRIASNADGVTVAMWLGEYLKSRGYQIAINLMQVGKMPDDDLRRTAEEISKKDTIDVFYFADSFGGMNPGQVRDTIGIIKETWDGPLGFHAHDNKGMALSNCLAAVDSGINYLDCTIMGMGRGAGNVRTENLLVELRQRGDLSIYPDAIFPLVVNEFSELQKRFGWGPNLYYFLAATYGIHPAQIQHMLGDRRYGTDDILSSITKLKESAGAAHTLETIAVDMAESDQSPAGTWSPSDWIQGRELIIVGPGEQGKRHYNALAEYARRCQPITLCLNINSDFPPDVVDAYVACHDSRILIEADRYAGLPAPLIIPRRKVPRALSHYFQDVEVFDFGMKVTPGEFRILSRGCIIPAPLALAYALSVAAAGGARRILLAGFDGYAEGDPRNKEVASIMELYQGLPYTPELIAITPTTYPVSQRSVYEPFL